MDQSEIARQKLLKELEEVEWDMSDDGLDIVTSKLEQYFSSWDEARDFVEENASYLFKLMEDEYA